MKGVHPSSGDQRIGESMLFWQLLVAQHLYQDTLVLSVNAAHCNALQSFNNMYVCKEKLQLSGLDATCRVETTLTTY